MTPTSPYHLPDEELQRRLAIDFPKRLDTVLAAIREFYPEATATQLAEWEADGALEAMMFGDEKRYFRRAERNFFRINPEAKTLYEAKYGDDKAERKALLQRYIPSLIKKSTAAQSLTGSAIDYELEFSLTVKPNIVPDGEMLRCWLPFARRDCRRQGNVRLLSTYPETVRISEISPHSALYFEQRAEHDRSTRFSARLALSCLPEFIPLSAEKTGPYDSLCPETTAYCHEEAPHIVFSREVRALSQAIVGQERNPYLVARRIFTWISENIPWAAAREYSTIDCIPDYVLKNRHGDCGQVTLLFISLCRLNGIPARWQSGFMLHTGFENLHDWAEIYLPKLGWLSVDQSFGIQTWGATDAERYFYLGSQDAFRWIVNSDIAQPLEPRKQFPRSETLDFQRGEVEWAGGNLYFDSWDYDFSVVKVSEN